MVDVDDAVREYDEGRAEPDERGRIAIGYRRFPARASGATADLVAAWSDQDL